jgi:peptidase M23-like protein
MRACVVALAILLESLTPSVTQAQSCTTYHFQLPRGAEGAATEVAGDFLAWSGGTSSACEQLRGKVEAALRRHVEQANQAERQAFARGADAKLSRFDPNVSSDQSQRKVAEASVALEKASAAFKNVRQALSSFPRNCACVRFALEPGPTAPRAAVVPTETDRTSPANPTPARVPAKRDPRVSTSSIQGRPNNEPPPPSPFVQQPQGFNIPVEPGSPQPTELAREERQAWAQPLNPFPEGSGAGPTPLGSTRKERSSVGTTRSAAAPVPTQNAASSATTRSSVSSTPRPVRPPGSEAIAGGGGTAGTRPSIRVAPGKPPFYATPLGQDLHPNQPLTDSGRATPSGNSRLGGYPGLTRSAGTKGHEGFDDQGLMPHSKDEEGSGSKASLLRKWATTVETRYTGVGRGTVVAAGPAYTDKGVYLGQRVTIQYRDADGTVWESTTMHHRELRVVKDQHIEPGQVIAIGAGSADQFASNESGATHVHWTLRRNGVLVDPLSGATVTVKKKGPPGSSGLQP